MSKYDCKDIIIDPDDPRLEIGKEYYFGDNVGQLLYGARTGWKTEVLRDVAKTAGTLHPFYNGRSSFSCLIRKKGPIYAECQAKWIADNGIEKGDYVTVFREVTDEDGWQGRWPRYDSSSVGKLYKVTSVSNANGINVSNAHGGGWTFPYFVLKKVQPRYEPFDLSNPVVRKSLRGKWIKNKNNNFELCITFFTHQGYVGNTIPADVYMVSGIDADELFQYWVFEDGSPCGKLAEEVENEA